MTIDPAGNVTILTGYLSMNEGDIYNVTNLTFYGGVASLDYDVGSSNLIMTNTTGDINIDTSSGHYTNIRGGAGLKIISGEVDMRNHEINNVSTFTRVLGGNPIPQPIFQQGATTGTGNNGSTSVTIPQGYTSVGSYQVFVTHTNSSPPNISVVRNTSNAFTIYWTNAGGGTQPFDWMTAGN
jgi:hypothetical protein